jgi:hypothetical protein
MGTVAPLELPPPGAKIGSLSGLRSQVRLSQDSQRPLNANAKGARPQSGAPSAQFSKFSRLSHGEANGALFRREAIPRTLLAHIGASGAGKEVLI